MHYSALKKLYHGYIFRSRSEKQINKMIFKQKLALEVKGNEYTVEI